MARLEVIRDPTKSVWTMFDSLEGIPTEVQDSMLKAEAAIVERAQRTAAQGLNQKGYGTGGTADALTVQGPYGRDGKRYMKIWFKGRRKNGKGSKSAGEVAFFNEFGNKNIHGRSFIRNANSASADEALAAATREYDAWLNKI